MRWFILTIIAVMLVGDLLWWIVADRLLRRLPQAWLWRSLMALFMATQIALLCWVILGRLLGADSFGQTPALLLTATYLWHLLLLPLCLLGVLATGVGAGCWRLAGWVRALGTATGSTAPVAASAVPATVDLQSRSRRQLLGAALAAAPPLLLASGVGASVMQAGAFRVRRIEVAFDGLPWALDGARIAHVSDLHVGRFTEGRTLERLVEATSALDADLVLLPGDLINNSLADLPAALDAVRAMRARHGAYLCLGNHDLIDNGAEFVARTRDALPLLIDEGRIVQVRGEPMQILGLSWSRGEEAMAAAVRRLAGELRPWAFPILLAHHPHAFDTAAEVGIPLTLSGHTHGGQLMLPGEIGFGPLMYRYWSGLYRRPGRNEAALVVSNGAGNWLPLRTNAPAEIIEIVLRSGAREDTGRGEPPQRQRTSA
jgi:hypothetical protein